MYWYIGIIVIALVVEAFFLKKRYYKQTQQDLTAYEEKQNELEQAYEQKKNELDQHLQERADLLDRYYGQVLTQHQQKIAQLNEQQAQQQCHIEEERRQLSVSLQREKDNFEKNLNEYKVNRQQITDEQVLLYEAEEKQKIELKLKEQEMLTGHAREELQEDLAMYGDEVKKNLGAEIAGLLSELEDYKKKRNEINEAILRERAITEKQDFYRIQIEQSALDDIATLRSVLPSLHNADAFNKLIYDLYIARPVKEMEKRVLNDEVFSGIYKITGFDGQIYIGRSTDIKSRWQQHAKSCFHTGAISRSSLHAEMEKKGIQNFTFEVLEKVPKDKLSEREKFWISFYESDKYGLNMKAGG